MTGDLGPEAPLPREEILKLLLDNQKENTAFVRHHEDIRFKFTQITVTLSALLLGASRFASQGANSASKWPIATFIIILGIIGVLVSAKYSERADRHATISRAYRRTISKMVGQFQGTYLEQIHREADAKHTIASGLNRLFTSVRVRYFWFAIHVSIILLGFLVGFF